MGTFADSLFAVLMSWVRALVNAIWALFTSEQTTMLEFLGKNWLTIVIVLIVFGLFVDWIIWMIRWKPYTLWAQRARRLLRIDSPEEDDEKELFAPVAAPQESDEEPEEVQEKPDAWLPEQPVFAGEDEQSARERADAVPDEELGVYPGMRYDEQNHLDEQGDDVGGTRRFAAASVLRREGPGAAEVSRRREEIDAYRREQEEAARMERERRIEAMRRAAEKRREEEERLAEETRLAQESYAREMAEYERRRAQYELELAQYQKDMQEYEAALAAQRARESSALKEIAQELAPQTEAPARRTSATYSDMVAGDVVEELPQTPQWPRMETAMSEAKKADGKKARARRGGLAGKMAHLIEPETEEITGVNALPPRVDPKAAYKPAAQPETAPRKRRK